MNAYDSIITRRSTRKYLDKPVERELLERVYGSMILGYPDTSDKKPVRTSLKRNGNQVTWH